MTTRPYEIARFALALYLIFLIAVLLQPRPVIAAGSIGGLTDLLVNAPLVGQWVTGVRVEFVMNVLAFAPLPFLGLWVLPKVTWSEWVAWGFLGSVGVEVIQGLFLDARSAQFVDVVANTAGAFLGADMAVAYDHYRRGGRKALLSASPKFSN